MLPVLFNTKDEKKTFHCVSFGDNDNDKYIGAQRGANELRIEPGLSRKRKTLNKDNSEPNQVHLAVKNIIKRFLGDNNCSGFIYPMVSRNSENTSFGCMNG